MAVFLAAAFTTLASDEETIGLGAMRRERASLTGTGIAVGQAEAGDPIWEVNPAAASQPVSLFTWRSSAGTATTFPNKLGSESPHANSVGQIFYGGTNGVAPGVSHVDNYEANFFFRTIVSGLQSISGVVVNQSFVFTGELPMNDRDYDDYAANFNVLFVSGVGNGGLVNSPSTAYNGIGVGAYLPAGGQQSSTGPTLTGRSKPDIVGVEAATSFSTPQVSGAAAMLIQAGARDDAGAGTASVATNSITLKALLLNGAVKPADWTNLLARPLDTRYGAGVLHIYIDAHK